MNKKILPFVLLAGTVLAACGKTGTEITFWTGFGTNVKSVLEPMLEDYYEATGKTAYITHESKGGYDNLYQAIAMSVTTRSYPNIALAYPDHMANYIHSNIMEPLNGYIGLEGSTMDTSDFIDAYMAENTAFGKVQSGIYEGQDLIYGVPFNKSTEVMVYNKTFFEIAGQEKFSEYAIRVPETWDEVKTIGTSIIKLVKDKSWFGKYVGSNGVGYATAETCKLKSGEDYKLDFSLVSEDNFHPFSYDSQSNFFITMVRQWGGTYTYIEDDLGYYGFDSQVVRDGMKFFQELAGYNSTTGQKDATLPAVMGIPVSWDESSYCSNPFKACKSVMNIGSSGGVYNAVPSGDGFTVDVAHIPYKDAQHKYVISQGTNLILTNKGDEAQRIAAFRVIEYMTSTEFQTNFALESGYYPATKSALNSEEYQGYLADQSGSSTVKVNRGAAIVNANEYLDESKSWVKFVDPGFEGSTTIREKIAYIMPNIMAGDGMLIEDALAAVFAQIRDYKPSAK